MNKGIFLNLIKVTYEKRTSNIMLNGERLDAFLLSSGTSQGCLLSPLLLNIIPESLVRTIWQEKERKASRLERKNSYRSLQMTWSCIQEILRNSIKTIRTNKWVPICRTLNQYKKIKRISTHQRTIWKWNLKNSTYNSIKNKKIHTYIYIFFNKKV